MAGIKWSGRSAGAKISRGSWRIVHMVLTKLISDHDGAENPERGAVRADLFLHCICMEQAQSHGCSE